MASASASLVIYLLITLLSGGEGGLGQLAPLDDRSVGRGDTPSEISQECQTGQDANERQDCRIVGVVNSVQRFWDGVFQRSGRQYPYADTVFFTDQIQTGCGLASSAGRPVLLPAGPAACTSTSASSTSCSRGSAPSGGPFAQAYVIAHEYGHHVQNQLGVLDSIRGDRQGPQSKAVRSELQADCYAGVWAANAVSAGVIEELTQADINDGLDAANAIGDDRIQEQTQGQVNPETWTHGSSEQRRRWFSRGYENGKPAACDTFSGSI